MNILRVVLDTNVIFEGLTQRQGVCGAIIDAWFEDIIQVHISNALAYEYSDVLSRKLSPARYTEAINTLDVLLSQAKYVTINFRWRPSSPDPGDEFLIDCAMNANAVLITSNVRDFRLAQHTLGLAVLTPQVYLRLLLDE